VCARVEGECGDHGSDEKNFDTTRHRNCDGSYVNDGQSRERERERERVYSPNKHKIAQTQ